MRYAGGTLSKAMMPDVPQFDRRELTDLVRASYNHTAAAYGDLFARELDGKPADRALLERFAGLVRPGTLVADIGCGPGHVAAYLSTCGPRMCGIDLSREMLRDARRRSPGLPAATGNMLALPVRDGVLGGIVAFYSIIHVLRDDAPDAVREFARTLSPGGVLLLSFHGGVGEIFVEEVFGAPVPMYATLYEADEMARYVRTAGFEITDIVSRPPYPAEYPTERVYILARRVGTTDIE